MTGRRSHRTYAFRSGSECWAFVPHPDLVGMWMRLHPSVLVTTCPFCKVSRGVPCRTEDGYVHYVHADRRRVGAKRTADLEYALGLVVTLGK
jgi:hypothetical protein